VRVDAIAQMKADVASGKAHPMALKKELARGIVADFHSAEAASKAAEDWAKQFQRGQAPDELELVEIQLKDVQASVSGAVRVIGGIEQPAETDLIRIDKLVRLAGLAASNTEAAGKHKQGAVSLVRIDGENIDPRRELVVFAPTNQILRLRVGRRMKKVLIVDPSGGKWQ